MGFFSWETSDTNRSICNCYSDRETFPVYVLCPDGTSIKEEHYEGYGIFGGEDIYELVAKWNIPERCKNEKGEWLCSELIRKLGIGIACYDYENKGLKYPIKIVEDNTIPYEEAYPSISCSSQGYFYNDGAEDYDEDDYEEDYEEEIEEGEDFYA